MITRITGKLIHVSETEATLEVGAFEYEVFVPDFVRRQLQPKVGESVSLRTIEYLEGNAAQGGKLTPRMIGFLSEVEREFFDLICAVDGVGVKKALRSMVRPVREVAVCIEEQDTKGLSALPGIGAALAERIIAKLRRKMTKFALMAAKELPPDSDVAPDVITVAFEALLALGHSSSDARQKIEAVTQGKKKFKSVEDLLTEIYRQEHPAS